MLNSNNVYDVVIVGASFAGLTCAKTSAMRGLKVLVIDSKSEAGAKVRTTGIMVKEAADEVDLPIAMTRKVRKVRLYAPSLYSVNLEAPGYYFLTTDTRALLRWFALDAEMAGAELRFKTKFDGADRVDGGFFLKGVDVHARFLVGADGARSTVARHFGLSENRRFLMGVEVAYEPITRLDGDFLHCFIDRRLAPGYIAWAAPGVDCTQVGLATTYPMAPSLHALHTRLDPILNLTGRRILHRRSGLIPAGGLLARSSGERLLLIGDAAGWVSPLTGGGIQLALRYGRRSAQLISDYLFDGGGEPGTLLAREVPRFGFKTAMRRLMNIAPPNWAANLAMRAWPIHAAARQIYFHHRGVGVPTMRTGGLDKYRTETSFKDAYGPGATSE
jgi:flavin-dependent dehydrogenase